MIASVRRKVESVGQVLAADQLDALMCAEVDSHLQSAIALDKSNMSPQALEELKTANALVDTIGKAKASPLMLRMGAQVHAYLASFEESLIDSDEAAWHAVEAMRWTSSVALRASRFNALARVALRSKSSSLILDFCEAVFAKQDRGISAALANASGRYVRTAELLLSTIEQVVYVLYPESGERIVAVLSALDEVGKQLLGRLERRVAPAQREQMSALYEQLKNIQSCIDASAALEPPHSAKRHGGRPSPKADK
jgi:uncharacterized coiled-coil protein SlyX